MLAQAGEKPTTLKDMLEPVAKMPGNTPAIGWKIYVRLVVLYKSGAPSYPEALRFPGKTKYPGRYERGPIDLLDKPGG